MGASTRTPAQFRDAVRTAFGAHWTAAGKDLAAVAWDNLAYNPGDRDEYLSLGLAHASGSLASLGAGTSIQVRRQAIFAGQLFVRHNTGQANIDALSEIILDFLESLRLTGIRVREPSMVEAGRVNQYFQVNITAIIEYDSFRTV